ncbi:protein FAR1-RELATED SEQUENCE 5-like [Salvia miltiorrhiza]|uniref:protein FAR1-RELATED SEQUENCE 5-like n=1 Tax=Salvia miltiorrhiza TaxID=226208 RepID=UPI0025AC4689|nr:protein FAR1-RELATED SEQUENCE 5-like [Salvia miltiorrhiza]
MGSTGNIFDESEERELCLPSCHDSMKPFTGQTFDTLAKGVKFYKDYAKASGFQPRMSTVIYADDGTVKTRYVVCNRQGVWDRAYQPIICGKGSKTKKRKTTSCKADCRAKAIFQISTGGFYRIREFSEGHTHSMVPAPARHLMACNRKIDDIHEMIIISGIKANIGPMRTFRLFREIVGNYEDMGCTSMDFKNYVRDLKVYSLGSDAHMLLEAFTNKQDLGTGFKFFHDVDEENQLRRLIWIDAVAVKNYKLFGEAVSFDATYNTNRYKMIFTPFTGRDNHGRCISFGAAIISNEDTESYAWVFDKFVEIMGRAPGVLITDQDPAVKKAVASSWKETRHSALDSQRHTYQKMTLSDETRVPKMMSNLPIEEHSASIFTNAVFKEVQDEIDHSIRGCGMRKMYEEGGDTIYVVDDNIDGNLTVRHIHSQEHISCSCNLFIRRGTICKHMFFVFRNLKIDKIPDKYIVKRWCKFSILCPEESRTEDTNRTSHESTKGDFRFYKVLSDCISFVKGNQELSEQLYSSLISVRDKFAEVGTKESAANSKKRTFLEFYGSAPTESPSVLPPNISKMKGSGVGGRRKSDQEKAMILAQKPLRLCRKCQTKGHHDSRNCPTKFAPNL